VLLGWPVLSEKVQERWGKPNQRERTIPAGFRRGAHRECPATLAEF